MKVLSVLGTRPEAIKMAPLIRRLENTVGMESVVCTTGQHREMLAQVLSIFGISADHSLDVMVANQTLNGLCAQLFQRLDAVVEQVRPDRLLVHGDTTTAMAAALVGFHRRIPIGHVEAGLRTGDLQRPWPEEMNRRVVDVVADHLFAPTPLARVNLGRENLGGRISVTGNTVIDALAQTVSQLDRDERLRSVADAPLRMLDPDKRLLLVTGHRRESFGSGFESICVALSRLARRDDLQIVYPVHLNPNVQKPVHDHLGGLRNVHLMAPLDYVQFVRLMQRADVVLTDSGGVQEEAPALGKPVFVMRDVTERPEAVEAGVVRLVGTDVERIVDAIDEACSEEPPGWAFRPDASPYGDGRACERIAAALQGAPFHEFVPARLAGAGQRLAATREVMS